MHVLYIVSILIQYFLYNTYICNIYTMNPHICIQLDGMPAGSPYM